VSPRILVLDDDATLLKLLGGYFGALGWEVEVASDPVAARSLVESDKPYDVVICDLHFTPARDAEGLDILKRARESRPSAGLLLFTAAAEQRFSDAALEGGADEVIAKPASLSRLRDAALRAMKKR
jgi:DNA-binding response OmpR family regulator